MKTYDFHYRFGPGIISVKADNIEAAILLLDAEIARLGFPGDSRDSYYWDRSFNETETTTSI